MLSKNEIFIEKAIKVHGDKYDYSKVEYIDYLTPVCIICPKHGEFWQKPNTHLGGSGCPKCGKEERAQAHRKLKYTTEEIIQKAKEKYETWKKQKDEIKIGHEVYVYNASSEEYGVVTSITENYAQILMRNGCFYNVPLTNCTKTGKYFLNS